MFGQSYNFSVSAENCVELGEDSNIVSATLPGEGIYYEVHISYYYNYHLVPPSVDVNVCLNYNNDITKLVLSWIVR